MKLELSVSQLRSVIHCYSSSYPSIQDNKSVWLIHRPYLPRYSDQARLEA